jgi:hypothetical protein
VDGFVRGAGWPPFENDPQIRDCGCRCETTRSLFRKIDEEAFRVRYSMARIFDDSNGWRNQPTLSNAFVVGSQALLNEVRGVAPRKHRI